jgi:hypothetical protein
MVWDQLKVSAELHLHIDDTFFALDVRAETVRTNVSGMPNTVT